MSKEKKQKVYITKYWQTEGIYTTYVIVCDPKQYGKMACLTEGKLQYFHKNDFFFTAEEAIEFVVNKQRRAIVLAKQKVKKLENMDITKITEKE